MSQTDELLNNASSGAALYSVNPSTEGYIVVNDDRTVFVPEVLKKVAVQFDHNVETVTFQCPRYWDGIDMSNWYVYIKYLRPDKRLGLYYADDVRSDDQYIYFDWTLSKNTAMVKGILCFMVCIKEVDASGHELHCWHSRMCTDMYVSEGMEFGEIIEEEYPDVIAQLQAQIDAIETGGGGGTGGEEAQIVYRATDYGISTDAENNTPALQALIDSLSAKGGGVIFFPSGTYNFKSFNYRYAVEMKSNVSIIGENIEKTVLKQTENKPYALFFRILDNGAGAENPLTGCVFKNFTVDAYGTGNTNQVWGKAFFFQYVRDCVFRDLRLLGTTATAMGIDFIDRVVIDNVSCIDCGRTFTGTEAGTSGIGIGTAGWENENFIITNCVCDGCGQYGIFIENQGIFSDGNVPYAKGCIISNCIVRNGINKGIGIRGGQNVTVIGCESYENAFHGIYIDNNCKNVKVLSCSGANNGGSGICIEPNETEHLLVKGCTFVNNQAEGIKVNVGAGKNANKLCIQDCYTDGNTIGMDLSASYLSDCVILGNTTLDGINSNTTFTGNTEFNSLVNAVDPDTPSEPTVQSIIVSYSSMTPGKKLMPDGSLVDGTTGTYATEEYIDVSMLTDTMILRYPATTTGAIRIAQYDSNKTSLGTSFGLDNPTETTEEYNIWQVTKLDGCHYVRIFLSGGFYHVDGEIMSVDSEADGKIPVRGIDYWTEADKAEIKSYVDEAILGGVW